MKRSEIAQILTMAKAIDDRVTVDEARVLAWEFALYPEIDLEFAKQALGAHYRASERPLMPVHINDPWKAHRRSQSEKLVIERVVGVPPTDEWKTALEAIRKGVHVKGAQS